MSGDGTLGVSALFLLICTPAFAFLSCLAAFNTRSLFVYFPVIHLRPVGQSLVYLYFIVS